MNLQVFIMRYAHLLWFSLVFHECMGYQVFEKDCMGTKFVVLIDEDDKQKAKRGANAAY